MESFIRANLRSGSSSDVKQIEKEIDGVFYAYGDRTGLVKENMIIVQNFTEIILEIM